MSLPIVILPGYLAGATAYRILEQSLQGLGFPTVTVPLRWQDWVPTIGGRSVAPILRMLEATVQQVLQQQGVSQVNLVGHSAGGWLARIYLGEKPYCIHPRDAKDCLWAAHDRVASLITLGTPHTSMERWTRKNLDFVNLTYPGAFYSDVNYVCVAGKAIFGDRAASEKERWQSWLAYNSYQLTCGQGNTWGDGITPIVAAHLEGAKNLILDGARHSPNRDRRWYGSPGLLEQWTPYLQ